MIECNIFEIEAELAGRTIQWAIYTDLPCGAILGFSCDRAYCDFEGSECVWTLFDDAVVVEPTSRGDLNGANGIINIDEGDKAGLEEFNELTGAYSKGIKEAVSDKLIISAVLGARQRLKAFGRNNINLHGGMVQDAGGINVVDESVCLSCPMKKEFQPIET